MSSLLLQIKNFIKTDFVKSVLILMTGTALAQFLSILISPLLTRVFSPEDFGLYGLYSSIVAILCVFSTGRYDLAIFEPKENRDANSLFIISVLISLIFFIILNVIIFLIGDSLGLLLNQPEINYWLFFIPISVFSVSFATLLNNWVNRFEQFKLMSLARIINVIVMSSISLSIGYFLDYNYGLIIGYLIGQIILFGILFNWGNSINFQINFKELQKVSKEYFHYPKFLIPATFSSEVSGNLPIILFTKLFSLTVAGYYMLASRVVTLPFQFIGNSIGEVYRQKSSQEFAKIGNCRQIYLETLKKLFFLAIITFLFLFLFSVPIFKFVFGENWEIAGLFSKYLSFMVFFQIISTPLAHTIIFNKSQKYDMYLQFFRVIFSTISIFTGFYLNDYLISIKMYALTFSLYYIAHSLIQYRASIGNYNNKN